MTYKSQLRVVKEILTVLIIQKLGEEWEVLCIPCIHGVASTERNPEIMIV
jgi:hypothetical protein